MQNSAPQSGNQNGQKQGGLSWTQPPTSGSNMNANSNTGAKPISQVGTSAMPNTKPAATPKPLSNMPSNSNKNNNGQQKSGSGARTAGVFVAGVIVGLIIGWGWFSLGKDTTHTVATNEVTGTTSNTVTGSSPVKDNNTSSSGAVSAGANGSAQALSVNAQAAGLSVMVSKVAVSAPTWVVVYDNVNGIPGNALGARMFFPGETSGTIALLRATIAGKTYFVGEYVDNGDHKYSKQTDSQVKTVAGTPLMVQFTTR